MRPLCSGAEHLTMDAITALKTRRSIRAYRPQPVARQTLIDLVDAARLAPTAMNQQLWEFVIITRPQILQQAATIIGHARFLASAAAAIAVLSKPAPYWIEDASAATENLLLAAHAHGLGACWIVVEGQPYAPAVAELLGAPPDYRVLCIVSLGYPAESPAPEKRSLESLLHWERFAGT
jgi:nitroreductase